MLVAPVEAVLLAALVALLVDALLGEPARLYARIPHPVVVIGNRIAALEQRWWRAADGPRARRAAGRRLVAAIVAGTLLVGVVLTPLLWLGAWGAVLAGVLASSLVAQKSLVEHVGAVARGLDRDLDAGRRAVAMIVGRDPQALDAAGVARAAVESAAENFADGVTAPLFWWLVLGPPGLLAYKAINTLDSMVGYRSERYRDFGRPAAKLDDRANWLPARLTGVLMAVVGGRPGALRTLPHEARKHRSPNAGWPEAAVALVLGFSLAGPRIYPAGVVADEWIGAGRRELGPGDIRRTLALVWRVWAVLVAGLVLALVL